MVTFLFVNAVRTITSAVPLSVPGIKETMAYQWTESRRDFMPVEKSACTFIYYIVSLACVR